MPRGRHRQTSALGRLLPLITSGALVAAAVAALVASPDTLVVRSMGIAAVIAAIGMAVLLRQRDRAARAALTLAARRRLRAEERFEEQVAEAEYAAEVAEERAARFGRRLTAEKSRLAKAETEIARLLRERAVMVAEQAFREAEAAQRAQAATQPRHPVNPAAYARAGAAMRHLARQAALAEAARSAGASRTALALRPRTASVVVPRPATPTTPTTPTGRQAASESAAEPGTGSQDAPAGGSHPQAIRAAGELVAARPVDPQRAGEQPVSAQDMTADAASSSAGAAHGGGDGVAGRAVWFQPQALSEDRAAADAAPDTADVPGDGARAAAGGPQGVEQPPSEARTESAPFAGEAGLAQPVPLQTVAPLPGAATVEPALPVRRAARAASGVPAGRQRPRPGGPARNPFSFFGRQGAVGTAGAGAAGAAAPAPAVGDLADIVGDEAVAASVRYAAPTEPEPQLTAEQPAEARPAHDRAAHDRPEVVDLTPHDETECLNLPELRATR